VHNPRNQITLEQSPGGSPNLDRRSYQRGRDVRLLNSNPGEAAYTSPRQKHSYYKYDQEDPNEISFRDPMIAQSAGSPVRDQFKVQDEKEDSRKPRKPHTSHKIAYR